MATAFTIKGIKPQKLRVDDIRLKILNELRAEGRVQKKLLEKTVSAWKIRVGFDFAIGLTRNDATVLIGPSSGEAQIWNWLDEGTRPHRITARRAPALRFQVGYRASTTPGVFNSRPSEKFGEWRRPYSVMHPGTKARKWSEKMEQRRRKPFQKRILKAAAGGSRGLF